VHPFWWWYYAILGWALGMLAVVLWVTLLIVLVRSSRVLRSLVTTDGSGTAASADHVLMAWSLGSWVAPLAGAALANLLVAVGYVGGGEGATVLTPGLELASGVTTALFVYLAIVVGAAAGATICLVGTMRRVRSLASEQLQAGSWNRRWFHIARIPAVVTLAFAVLVPVAFVRWLGVVQ
jgi:hypothetical protein